MSSLRDRFASRRQDELVPLAEKLEREIVDILQDTPRVDRVTARAKTVESFVAKAARLDPRTGRKKYKDPLSEIQDQIGVRVVTFYPKDVEIIGATILEYFNPIEQKLLVPDGDSEFGYVGKHFILPVPTELLVAGSVKFFELQVKTLFQHAWSEANHDLAYKPTEPLSPEQKRRVAFIAAQAWGADHIFAELSQELGIHP